MKLLIKHIRTKSFYKKLCFLIFRFDMENSIGRPFFEEIRIPVPFGYISG